MIGGNFVSRSTTTVAGSLTGNVDGPTISSRFDKPMGFAFVGSDVLYLADSGNNKVVTVVSERLYTPHFP